MPDSINDMQKNPFHKAPDPGNMFATEQVEEAIARLEHGALEREVTVLTGDIGVGKTTVTRAVVDRLEGQVRFVWILNPRLTANQLLQQIGANLQILPVPKNKVELLDAIEHHIVQAWENETPIVFLIDEAQLLPLDTLEELRLLTNFQLDTENLLGLILVGQPELDRKLALPRFQPLTQRIGIRYHLRGLDVAQIQEYIQTRLQIAGAPETLFTPDAVHLVGDVSQGIPRVINNLCGNALLAAYGAGLDHVDEGLIADVARDLGLVRE